MGSNPIPVCDGGTISTSDTTITFSNCYSYAVTIQASQLPNLPVPQTIAGAPPGGGFNNQVVSLSPPFPLTAGSYTYQPGPCSGTDPVIKIQ
jgi:hypothetical protein